VTANKPKNKQSRKIQEAETKTQRQV